MWDMLLSFLPIMLLILGILIFAIVTLKLLEARRNAKLKREYEAQQKKHLICLLMNSFSGITALKRYCGIEKISAHFSAGLELIQRLTI